MVVPSRWYATHHFDRYPAKMIPQLARFAIERCTNEGDTVLDPFWGTGTTTFAAITAGRNSIGYEIDTALANIIDRNQETIVTSSSQYLHDRLARHIEFVRQRKLSGGSIKYLNVPYGFPVVTAQEKELLLNPPGTFKKTGLNAFEVSYDDTPQAGFCKNWEDAV